MKIYVDEEKKIELAIGQDWLIDKRGYALMDVSLKNGVLFRGRNLTTDESPYETTLSIEQLGLKMKLGEAFNWTSICRSRALLVTLAFYYKSNHGISHDTEVPLAEIVEGVIGDLEKVL